MPLSLLLLALAAAQPAPCARPAAPDEAAARRIAEREISGRPRTGVNFYQVNVIPDTDRPGQWLAYQSVIPGTPPTGRPARSMRGGGGIAMNIDRCTGAVSNLHHQR